MIKVAAIQFSGKGDGENNFVKAMELSRLAVERGAKLIAFPELCSTKWFPSTMRQGYFDLAETIPGPSSDRMCRFALENDVVVVLPLFEKAGKGKYYNSAAVIDANGALLGVYRKVHVPSVPGWNERFYFLPGDLGFPVFPTKLGRIGVQISWDVFFPEGPRILALKGAELLVVPTSNAHASYDRWERMLAGNAISNGLFILRINRVGKEGKQTFYGKSFCMDPHGELIHKAAGGRDSVHLTALDLGEVGAVRNEWAFFRDRREDIYDEVRKRMTGADELGMPLIGYSGNLVSE